LVVSAFSHSLAFPGLISVNGVGFIAFFSLIPVFLVIRNTTWKLTPFYGFFYGFVFYLFFNYWLKTFHPLAILIVPIIKGGEMLMLFPLLKAAQKL
jgi:apolipoprotein N-acyltransferase